MAKKTADQFNANTKNIKINLSNTNEYKQTSKNTLKNGGQKNLPTLHATNGYKFMSNYRRADAPGASYFFTVVTFRRRNILTDDDCRAWLRNAVKKTRESYPFTIDAWVLLPDHLHCILTLPENDNNFSVRWNGIKKRFTTAAKHKLHKPEWVNASKQKHREGTIWQRRFWD